jgi:hypothetical protein
MTVDWASAPECHPRQCVSLRARGKLSPAAHSRSEGRSRLPPSVQELASNAGGLLTKVFNLHVDVVCFPRGEKGAHQIINRTESPIRVVMLSSMVAPDIVHYPDTEKVSASSAEGEPIMLARRGPTLEYWEGEE